MFPLKNLARKVLKSYAAERSGGQWPVGFYCYWGFDVDNTLWCSMNVVDVQFLCLLKRSLLGCFYSMRHDDVIKRKRFPRYWPFVRGIHRSPVNSPHKSKWRRALTYSLICVWINGWVNSREAGDFSRYRTCYDVIVMESKILLYFGLFSESPVSPRDTRLFQSNNNQLPLTLCGGR